MVLLWQLVKLRSTGRGVMKLHHSLIILTLFFISSSNQLLLAENTTNHSIQISSQHAVIASVKTVPDNSHQENSHEKQVVGKSSQQEHVPEKKHHSAVHWTYHGTSGPYYWGKLSSEYAACSNGRNQSPINLIPGFRTRSSLPFRSSANDHRSLPAIQFHYLPSPVRLVNNGHTIQMNYAPGSSVTIGNKVYQLLQFDFHLPSEHLLMGRSSEMEMHLVHKNESGEIAVIGLLMRRGTHNRVLQVLWDHLPKEQNREFVFNRVFVNAADLLPPIKSYFHYSGSLTTPPCTEAVQWFVLKSPIILSEMQLMRFRFLIPFNARPVQRLYQRQIFEK